MAIDVFNLDLVVTKLKAPVVEFKTLGLAGDLAAIGATGIKNYPAGYVIPLRDTADANDMATQIVSQRCTTRFGVVYAVKNLRDQTGGKAALSDLGVLRNAVLTALVGWQPNTDCDLVTFGGGRLIQVSDSVVWWQDEFLTSFYIRT